MFNFGGNKVKSITISPSNEYVIWEEKLEDLAKDCALIVSPGCVGLYIVNGALKSTNTPGKWIINSKDEVKDKSQIRLICVNSDKIFEVFCGAGNIPFHDDLIKADGTVAAHGDCKLRISHAWSLYTAFGHAPITASEIDEFAKAKLIEILSGTIAAFMSESYYEDIKARQVEISAYLEKQFKKALINIGLEVDSFALRGITFGEEYLKKRQEYYDNKKRKKEEAYARQNAENELSALADFIKETNTIASQAPAAPQEPEKPDHTNQYCPKCGAKLPSAAKFCSSCGAQL